MDFSWFWSILNFRKSHMRHRDSERAMSSYRVPKIPSSEITPKSVYLNRRSFMGAAAAGLFLPAASALATPLTFTKSKYAVDEPLTPQKAVTTYNNYYEFGTGKADPAANAQDFKARPGRSRSMAWWPRVASSTLTS